MKVGDKVMIEVEILEKIETKEGMFYKVSVAEENGRYYQFINILASKVKEAV